MSQSEKPARYIAGTDDHHDFMCELSQDADVVELDDPEDFEDDGEDDEDDEDEDDE